MTAKPLMAPVRIGRAVFDPLARRLLVQGVPQRVGGRAIDLLLLLIEHRERVVGKHEILDAVWSQAVVEENNLQVQVAALRRVLGAEAIVTVSGRGYRLGVPVEEVAAAASITLATSSTSSTSSTASASQVPSTSAAAPASAAATDPMALAPDVAPPGNLPALAQAPVGRDRELAEAAALLHQHRLLSIVGAGGIGKTCLALALAQQQRGHFADGAWLVELAPLQQADALSPALARSLGLSGAAAANAAAIATALAPRRMLLVLDNCEHLAEAVAALTQELLSRAPALRLLVTTQVPLHVPGERPFALPPLSLPADGSLAAARASGAVALFVERGRALLPGFVLGADNAAAVAEICRRLDGIALAIEMAAARLPLLGVDGIRERLHASLQMLTGGARGALPRQQTLRATLEWSLGLLVEDERRLFRRLGIFVGGFGLAAVRTVMQVEQEEGAATHAAATSAASDASGASAAGTDDWQLLDRLGRLVDKSLVISNGASSPRFRLLEPLRTLALEQVAQAGELPRLHVRHAAWLRALYGRADADHVELPTERWLAIYEVELPNLREALRWALGAGGDVETAVALVGSSAPCWFTLGQEAEALRYVALTRPFVEGAAATALPPHAGAAVLPPHVGAPALPPRVQARWWSAITTLALRRTIPAAQALEACDRALAIFATLGDTRQQYKLWCIRAYLSANAGAIEAARDAITQAESFEDASWPATVRLNRVQAESALYTITGALDKYLEAERRAARLNAAAGKTVSELVALSNVADAQLALGDTAAALLTVREVIERRRAMRLAPTAASFHVLTAALIECGDLEAASQAAAEAVPLSRASQALPELLDHLSLMLALNGRHRDAARVAGRADAAVVQGGFPRQPAEARSRARVGELLLAAVSEKELAQLLADGAALDEDQAATLAVSFSP